MAETLPETANAVSEVSPSFFDDLQAEFKGIPQEKFSAHLLVMGEDDTYAQWRLMGLKPGVPAYIVEIAPSALLPGQSSVFRGTPLEHGVTFFVQPDGKGMTFIALAGTAPDSSWQKLNSTTDYPSLTRYFAEMRRNGQFYAPSKTAQDWVRFGKQQEAMQAFHHQMVQQVIRTPEMEDALNLVLQKATGRDSEALANVQRFVDGFVHDDAQTIGRSVKQLLDMQTLDKRLASALIRVRDLQADAREEFEERSSWSLRPPDMSGSGKGKKLVKAALVFGTGATILTGSAVAQESAPVDVDVQSAERDFRGDEATTLWGDSESKARLPASTAMDVSVGLSPSVLQETTGQGLSQSARKALQENGLEGVGNQWFSSLSDDARAAVENTLARVQQQLAAANPKEIEQVVATAFRQVAEAAGETDVRPFVLLAHAVGTAGLAYLIARHPKEMLAGLIGIAVLSGCGTGVPTVSATEVPLEAPIQAPYDGPVINQEVAQSGLTKTSISTTLDAAAYEKLHVAPAAQEHAKNAIQLFDALAQKFSEDPSVDLSQQTVNYISVVSPDGTFAWEIAIAPVKAPSSAQDPSSELAFVAFRNMVDIPTVQMVVWTPSEEFSEETIAATMRLLTADGKPGHLVMAVSPTADGALVILVDPNNVDAYITLVARSSEKISVMKLLEALGVLARPALAMGGETEVPPIPRDTPHPSESQNPTGAPLNATEVTVSSFQGIDWAAFADDIAQPELQAMQNAVVAEPRLTSDPDSVSPVSFTVNSGPDGTSVAMYGTPQNMTPRIIGTVQTDNGSVPVVVWELIVAGDDGKNHRVALATGHVPELPEFEAAQLRYLREIGKTVNSTKVTLIIDVTSWRSPVWQALLADGPQAELLAQWLIDHQGEGRIIPATNILGR